MLVSLCEITTRQRISFDVGERVVMTNRTYLILIVLLSCALLLVGGAFIGSALNLQGATPAAVFPTAPSAGELVATPAATGNLQKGSPAPDFSVETMDGKVVSLANFRGKPVMLNFWASWCGPCTAEMKNIEAVFQKHPNEDFVILGVNQGEGADTIKGYGELWKLNFRLVCDVNDEAARKYQIKALPTTVFVDADGNIYEVHVGGPVSIEFIEKRVEELLGK